VDAYLPPEQKATPISVYRVNFLPHEQPMFAHEYAL
jgi:hypothetical protein